MIHAYLFIFKFIHIFFVFLSIDLNKVCILTISTVLFSITCEHFSHVFVEYAPLILVWELSLLFPLSKRCRLVSSYFTQRVILCNY